MNTGTWPKINHSPSNKTTFCVYITWFLHFIAVFLSLQFFIFFNLDISDKRFSKKTWLVRKSLMILDGHPILVVSWISLDAFSRCLTNERNLRYTKSIIKYFLSITTPAHATTIESYCTTQIAQLFFWVYPTLSNRTLLHYQINLSNPIKAFVVTY